MSIHLFIFIYLPSFSSESTRPSDHHHIPSRRLTTATVLYIYYYDMHIKTIWPLGKILKIKLLFEFLRHEYGAPTIPVTEKVEK